MTSRWFIRKWFPVALRSRQPKPLTARPDLVALEDRTVPTVFSNPTTILVPQDQIGGIGNASPYPSTINVSGLAGVIKTVTVTMKGFSHTSTKDVDVLLVGPGGQAVKILSDTGGSGNLVSNINLTFDDNAVDFVPTGTGSFYSTDGTYKPTDFDEGTPDTFPTYAGTPSVGLNKTFRNTVGNGVWSLYIVDDASGDVGQLTTGWSLDIFSRVNTAPVGVNDTYTTLEDGGALTVSAANGVLLGTGKDTDANSDALIATLVSSTSNGTLNFNSDGSFDYTPFPDFSGADTFTYRPDDGFVQGSLATVTINVTNTDDPPTANPDYYVVSKGTKLSRTAELGVIANDIHPDGSGRVTLLSDDFETYPLIDYTAANVALGNVGNTPTTEDWTPNLPAAWSHVETKFDGVTPLTNEPVEYRGWHIHNIDSWIAGDNQLRDQFTLGGVGKAGRVFVADGDEYDDGAGNGGEYRFVMNTRAIDLRGVLPNSAKLEFDSSFRPEDFNDQIGHVKVSYDGGANFTELLTLDSNYAPGGNGDLSRVNEHVLLQMNNPVGKDSAIIQFEYTAGNDWWWAFDNLKVSGARSVRTGLTATKVANPLNGSLILNADGSFDYTPNASFTGTDTFTYTLTDGITPSGPVTVTLNVRDTNPNLPVANADSYSTKINTAISVVSNAGVLANDVDADGDPLSAILVTGPSKGALTFRVDGSFLYTPNAGTVGIDTFTYKANDVFGNSTNATVSVNVVGNIPVITSNGGGDTAAISLAENNVAPTLITTVTATHQDAGQVITYSISGGTDAGFFSIDSVTGKLSVTKALNFELPADLDENNTYQVIVRATDTAGSFDLQTVTLTVTDVAETFELLSDGGGSTATRKVSEHTLNVTTVQAAPAAGTTYALVGGADKARFAIDSATGKVTFLVGPDFEAPTDADLNNSYIIVVQAMNGSNILPQTLTVQVVNVLNEEHAYADSYSTQKANSLTVAAPGVLANDDTRITLFSEGFEGLNMKPFRTGTYVGKGDGTDFATEAPGGWTKITQQQNGTPLTDADPPIEYRGWVALDIDSWNLNQGQNRNNFTRGGAGKHGTVLVADGDTFANADGSGLPNKAYACDFTISMPTVSLSGAADNSARLEFDSSFRPEAAQTALVEYSLDGGGYTTLLTLDNAYAGGGGGGLAKVDEHLVFNIPNVGNSTLDVRFNYKGGNDWWWAIDNVVVTGTRPGATTPTAVLVGAGPTNGTLVGGLKADGSFTYSPNASFVGLDTFQYKVFDGVGFTPTTTVSIDVLSPRSITWTGAVDGNWDINTTANWNSGGSTTYKQADIPTFDNTATTKTITLNTTVLPGLSTFNAPGSTYTINGTGKISGTSGVTVVAGSLVLTTDNDYTGGTSVSNGSTLQLGAGGATGSIVGNITNNGSVVFNSSTAKTYSGNITGTGSVTQSLGTITLSGANNYSGGTTITGDGTAVTLLNITDSTSVGAGAITYAAANTRLAILGLGANVTNNISLPNVTGQVRLTTPNNTNTTFSGVISGGGPNFEFFIQEGTSGNTGSVTLSGVNTFTGKLNSQRGPLILTNASAVGTAFIYLDTNTSPLGDIQLTNNFTLPNNIVIHSGGTNKFAVDTGLSAGMSGIISSDGAQGFEKIGGGTLTISGANTFTGALNASGGTLLVNGTNTPSGSTISAGATLGGTGKINAATVAGTITGATDGTAGTLSTGNLAVTGTVKVDITGNAAGDQLAVTGTVDITGSTLALNVPNAITSGTKFTVVNNDTNTDAITGKFANLPNEGDTITASGQTFSISYVGGDGNDIVLTRQGAAAPVVTGFVVNNGNAQRSRLTTIQVNFASPVDAAQFQTLGAVTLTRTGIPTVGTAVVGTVVNTSNGLIVSPASGTVSSITLTFANVQNAGVEFGSLADGRWQLAVAPASYTSPNSPTDTQLRRLFGNQNNDTLVDAGDFGFFPNFGTAVNSPFDFNNDGDINASDLGQFGNRFGVTLV